MKSVCHISLQCSFWKRLKGFLLRDSSSDMSWCLWRMLVMVLGQGMFLYPWFSRKILILSSPQPGLSKRTETINSSMSSGVLLGEHNGLRDISVKGSPCLNLSTHLRPVLRVISYSRHRALKLFVSNAFVTNSNLCFSTVLHSHGIKTAPSFAIFLPFILS